MTRMNEPRVGIALKPYGRLLKSYKFSVARREHSTMTRIRNCVKITLLLCLWLLVVIPSRGQEVSPAQSVRAEDEGKLRKLAALYVTALVDNDQRALSNIVSAGSMFHNTTQSDIAEHNDAWQSVMASSTNVELRGFNVERIVISDGTEVKRRVLGSEPGPRASIFLNISIRAFDVKTGRPRIELLNMRRVIECAKLNPIYRFGKERIKRAFAVISYQEERPVWLIVGDEPDLKQLSKNVLAAKTSQDARTYLELENAESLRKLAPDVISQATTFFEQEAYTLGLHALQINQTILEEIKTKDKHTEKLREQAKTENALKNIEDSKRHLTEDREQLAKLEAVPIEKQTQAIKDTRTFSTDEIASDLSQIARYYSDNGQLSEALKYYEQSLRQYEKLDNKRMMADALGKIGKIYLTQNDKTHALNYWQQSCRLGIEGLEAKDAAIASGKINPRSGRAYSFEYEDGLPTKAVGEFTYAFTGFYERDDLARMLHDIGDLYLKQKNYEQSILFYRKSADQYELMVARSDEARQKEPPDTPTRVKPEEKSKKSEDKSLYSKNLWLGMLASELDAVVNVYTTQGRFDKAVEYYEQSAKEMQTIGKSEGAIEIYQRMAMIGREYLKRGQDEEAITLYERCIDKLKELNAQSEVGMIYLLLSQFYLGRNDYARTSACVEKGLTQLLSLGDHADEDDKTYIALLYLARAESFEAQGNYAEALQDYQKGRVLFDKSDSQKDMVGFFDLIAGSVYAAQGSEAIGIEMMRRSLPLSSLLQDGKSLPDVLNKVGVHYLLEGNKILAAQCFHDALKIAERIGAKEEAADSLGYLSDISDEQRDYVQALGYLNRRRQLVEKSSDQEEYARTLANIGNLYRKQKLYASALEYYEKSQKLVDAIGRKSSRSFLNDIAEMHHLMGNEAKALQRAEQSRVVAQRAGEREDLWQARSIMGQAYLALNRQQEAFQALDEAINTIEFIRLHLVGGEQERELFLEDKIAPYQGMLELLVKQNRINEALHYAERSKARVLLDVMQFGKLTLEAAMTAEEQATNLQILHRLTTLNIEFRQAQQRRPNDQLQVKRLTGQVQRARLEYETFQAEIYAAHPQLQELPAGMAPLNAIEASTLLPDANSALVEFVVMPARTYVFVFTKDISAAERAEASSDNPNTLSQAQWKVYPINITADEMAARVERYRNAIAPADIKQRSNDFKSQAAGLYDLLLKPAQDQLHGKSSLIIVPDGVLWNLPFQALQTPAKRFLLEDSAISYAPSLSVLREMRRVHETRASSKTSERVASSDRPSAVVDSSPLSLLLAFGDPDLGPGPHSPSSSPLSRRNQLDPLPETATEVKSAANLYGAQRSTYLIGPDATEENFKRLAENYRVLHLATHGLVNDQQPMYSQIVLSRTTRAGETDRQPVEDGYLEAWEIMRLRLNADLVVLSACETALGRIGNGEGMMGLTWALSAAGTPTIVASQWAVNSCSTTELMTEFHRQLKDRVTTGGSDVGPAEALRRASLTFLTTNAASRAQPTGCKLSPGDRGHPYFWAGFVVIGDGR